MNRPLRLIVMVVLITAACGALVTLFARHEMERAMNTPIPLDAPRLFTVRRGDNASTIARHLEAEGWLPDYRWFVLRARLDDVHGRLQAGTYELVDRMTPAMLLANIVDGDIKTFTLIFIEGTRFDDALEVLAGAYGLEQTLSALDKATIARRLGLQGDNPEGWLFPSTYHYAPGDKDIDVLIRAHEHMKRELDAAWDGRAENLPYTNPYEALIMASIVEKETGLATERGEIAGVFVRRLRLGMKLQTDPSVIYGLGEAFDGNLRRADLHRDTPYNTYTRTKLPPTPIALVGRAALDAALHPVAGEALYFVARGDGTHEFSKSLRDHNNAVRRYQLKR